MKGWELLRDSMKSLDISAVFGNPGTTEIPMFRSFDNYVLTLHDALSVGMADGYSQFSGNLPLVNLHTIHGVGNSIAFINTAKANRSPILITSGQQDTRHLFYDPILSYDLMGLVSDLVKYKYEIKHASEIPMVMQKARSVALTPPMGPVFISFPMDLLDDEGNWQGITKDTPNYDLVDESAVDYVAERIRNSLNPCIVAGYEIDVFSAHSELENLASKIGCPVYAEPLSSRAPVDSSMRNFAGDLLPATAVINLKLLNHDLILFIGGNVTLYPYLPSPILPGKEVLSVGFDLSRNVGQSIMMNPKKFMALLAQKVSAKGSYSREALKPDNSRMLREKKRMGIYYVMKKIAQIFNDHVIVDESISSSAVLRDILGYKPRSYFTARSGQLGWGLPASAGIGMAGGKVVLIIGDGAMMYSIQELWTIINYGIPLKIIVLKNNGYSILKSFSISSFPGMENRDYFSFDLPLDKIISSYGIETQVATEELKELSWLREGERSKALIINVDKAIPHLFP